MRLRVAATAAVVFGSVLTGGAVRAQAGAAANPAVTIRAIDREGKQVAVTASLQGLVAGGVDDTLTSAHPIPVPPGTYNLAAWVWEPGNRAATLVDHVVKITKSLTVAFDARPGKRIRFTVNDSTVSQDFVEAEPFSPSQNIEAFDGFSGTPATATYAVPGKLPSGWDLFLWADMIRPKVYLSPVEYQFVRVISGAIPAGLTFANDKAKLASDVVTVRTLDPGGTGGVGFSPSTPSMTFPAGDVGQWATPPFGIDFRFTPGYEWQPCVFYPAGSPCAIQAVSNLPVLGVHRYAQTFGSAVYGPSPQVGAFVTGNQLQAGGSALLVDPNYTASSAGLPVSSDQTWLYEGSKLLAKGGSTVTAKIPATAHWYTMRVQASRGSRATLAKSVTLYDNFQAAANGNSPDAFWPRIIPSGLSERNAARHGTRTTVPIWFTDVSGNVAVHGVKVWASANGGKTWKALSVSRSGDRWTVVVANPAAAPGYVSLRVQGTNSAGETVAVTAINAYAVS